MDPSSHSPQLLHNHHPQPIPSAAISHPDLHLQLNDLAIQVSLLNAKLVSSFERIANLEDELHESNQKNLLLEANNSALQLESDQHKEALNGGLLVERANVQNELQRLTQRLVFESEKRSQSEASLSSINQELDDLSASLFSEANRLVATEKLQRIKAERKVKDVEEAMKQVEEVIEARRDQLNHLRLSLESAERERDEFKAQVDFFKSSFNISDTPAGLPNPTSSVDSLTKSSSTASIVNSADSVSGASFQPFHQIKLSHEILPFTEFTQFIAYLRRTRTDLLTRPSQPPSFSESYYSAAAAMTSIASTAAITGITTHSSLAASSNSSKDSIPPPSPKDLLAPALPLSQHVSQPFLKRCLEEDSDPALRLDLAPGLNFISRRVILTALLEGHLVIEPVWSDHGSEYEKCTLCGCSLDRWLPVRSASSATNGLVSNHTSNTSTAGATMRKMLRGGSWGFATLNRAKRTSTLAALNTNTPKSAQPSSPMPLSAGQVTPIQDDADALYVHTFRAADSASTRYPICPTYCLSRLRSVCDFWRFVQSIELGLLLDENVRFMRYLNQPSPGIRLVENHSLGSAYDNALKRMRGKGKSLDSVNYSPILTHSIPSSSISSLAATFRPEAISEAVSVTGPAHSEPHHSALGVPAECSVGETVASQVAADLPLSQNTIQPASGDSETVDKVPEQPIQPSVADPSLDTQAPTEQHTASQLVQHQSDVSEAGLEQPHTPMTASNPKDSPVSCNTPMAGLSPAPPPIPRRSPARVRHAQSISSLPLTLDTRPRPDDSTEQNANSPTNEFTQTQVPHTNPTSDLPASSKPSDEEISIERVNKTTLTARHSTAEFVHGIETRTHSRNQSQSGVAELEAGWEERCWQQVVKLKEEMFMKRTGIFVGVNS